MAKPLQLVFRQTGHFHNRFVINTAFAHRFGNLQQGLMLLLLLLLLLLNDKPCTHTLGGRA